MRVLTIAAVAMASASCVTTRSGLEVDLALVSVQRPADVAERWGSYELAPADTSGYTYEDGLVSVAVVPRHGSFSALIENRTEHSIRIIWPEASYVGPNGLASGVVPGETRWIDMGNTPATQVIPTRAAAAIVIIPRVNANTTAQEIEGFYPRNATCADFPGAPIRLVMPLEIQGVTNEYTLQFEPTAGDLVTWQDYEDLNGVITRTTEQSRVPCS